MFWPLHLRWRTLLLALAWTISACQSADSLQEPLVVQQGWRIDASGRDSFTDAQDATDWQPLSAWKTWGFGPETVWVRLQLRAASADTHLPWIVRVRPAFLDYVTLYDPASGLVLRTGDALPPGEDGMTSINFTMQIPALPYARTVYLQMRSTSSRTMQVEVLPYGQAQRLNRLQEWLMGFVTAASAIFALWAFAQWLLTHDRVIGAFAFKQLIATFWALFALGFARIAIGSGLSEGVLTSMSSTIFPWTAGAGIWFYCTLIQTYRPSRLVLQVCRVLAMMYFALPALQWFDQTSLSLLISNLAIFPSLGLIFIALLSALPQATRQPIPLSALLAYILAIGTVNSVPILILVGWIEASQIVLFANLSHAVLDGLVMFVMLQVRAQRLQKAQQQIVMDLEHSQQQIETQKRHRAEQSQLFAMLAHEMKTPLATLRMWMDAGQLKPETMDRAIADMNSVIERCVHTGQLTDQGLRPVVQSVDPLILSMDCITTCRSPDRVDWVPPPTSGLLHTDVQMLSIVLGNLLENACKYSAPGSRIQFSLQSATRDGQAGWLWQLRNQAGSAGLPDAAHLFEKYYRSPQARRLSGSGLGLFLVKGLLELMQGRIAYESQDGHAVFSVWLPAQASVR